MKEYKLPPYEVKDVITTLSQKMDWGIVQNNIPKTWTTTQGEGVKVMVIDTGWSNHKDLGDNSLPGICTVPRQDVVDRQGHGTHVAGIIAAQNNSTGMVGVAPKATVIGVKALGDDGSGSYDSIAMALEYAIEQKPDVISMSLGSPSTSKRITKAVKKLTKMNIPIICAAGNDGARGVDYPGKYPETIAIAAYDKHGNIANFSGIGEQVDFAAPGVDIYSTYLKNRYAVLSGTSMACPFISGIVALLLAKHKKQEKETGKNDCKTIDQIKEHLLKYTIDKGIIGKDSKWGYGMIDVENMILDDTIIPVDIKTKNKGFNLFKWILKLFG
jgi:subtilisin family serine protease